MDSDRDADSAALNVDTMLLIVVGAHLRAEVVHRPIAYALRDTILARLKAMEISGFHPVVCSDVWYLNTEELLSRPTISIGGPELNALTAFIADKLPMASVVDEQYVVQLDVQFAELLAACWGQQPESTARACDVFIEKYLDGYLSACLQAQRA